MPKLTKEKEEALYKLVKEMFPMAKDLEIKVKDDKVYICSSLSVAEADLNMNHIARVEKLLNAEFKGIISNNGIYGSIYQLK
jgi:CRISPR/Cas system CMR subunit Cmr6 (Cas7 group RAMP superfamily)